MDKFKTYIKEHREEFDTESPSAGHFERFEAKQQQNDQPARRAVLSWHWAAAASVLLLFSVGIWHSKGGNNTSSSVTVLCNDPANMKSCYLQQMEETAEVIDQLSEKLDPFTRGDLQMTVVGIIDSNRTFDQDLPEELSKKETDTILSAYYRQNLEVLQRLAQQLAMK